MSSAGRPAIDVVCWDWNGTLLDDASLAMAAMNEVLEERSLPPMPDVEAYRQTFGFPVQAFYARLGIDGEQFRAAAGRYLALFATSIEQAPLHTDARAVLAAVGRLGVGQVLISATIPTVLETQMAPHGISGHFEQVLGITDAYAPSKAEVVARWLRSSGHDPGRVLMIGDTNHDEEIAEELHLGFVRFARGHQAPPDHDRHPVVQQLRDALPYVHRPPSRVPGSRRPASR